jgi:uncharacterized protein (TIGR03435 family)
MILLDASLRAIPISAVAATVSVVAKWRGKPLAAKFEHSLWTCVLIAMLAFAIPKITVHAGAPITIHYASTATDEATQSDPSAISIPNPASNSPASVAWPNVWLIIWLAGAGLMAVRIVVGLFLTDRSLADARTIPGDATGIGHFQESDNAIVPMTIGWPRTRIVLPMSWHTWPNDKLRAVMLHELAHVRRRDSLVTFLAAINKAIFWFHPLAWWLESRLAELAEFAADDAAVKASIDPRDYASILIDIASGARPTRLRLSSDFARHGFNRINRRVERICDSSDRTGSMKIVWTAATLIAAITLVQFQRPIRAQEPTANHVSTQALPAQPPPVQASVPTPVAVRESPQRSLTFDVVSVRPVAIDARGGERVTTDSGRYRNPAVSLKELLHDAYGVESLQIVGPSWLDAKPPAFFDVEATMPPDTTNEQLDKMLQNLLVERFGLVLHRETRELRVYSLLVAKGGPKMKESVETQAPEEDFIPDHPRADGLIDAYGLPMLRKNTPGIFLIRGPVTRLIVKQQTMADFAKRLVGAVDRMVLDATGLTAKYDFTVTFANEGSVPQPEQLDGAPDVRVALQEQLGLRLESGNGPVEVLVVDHIEKTPTEN